MRKKTAPTASHTHGTPRSRRDFLAQGVLPVSAALLTPGILSALTRQAYGATDPAICGINASSGKLVPVLIFDLAGGGNIAGTNVVMGLAGGQSNFLPVASYRNTGLSAAAAYGASGVTPDGTFGLLFHPKSPMLAGLKSGAPTAAANTEGTVYLTITADDTANNPLNPIYWLAKAGLSGSLMSLTGMGNSLSGGNSTVPQASIDPARTPTIVHKPADAAGLVDPGKLATLLSTGNGVDAAAVSKIMNATKTMSAARLERFNSQDLPTQIRDLINCGYINSSNYFTRYNAAALDPMQDAAVTGIYGPDLGGTPESQAAATVAKLVLDGYAGAGVVTLGGYDYHGLGRTAQAAKDREAGLAIGRALELAAKKRSPLFIYVITDGGLVAGDPNNVDGDGFIHFTSDAGLQSASFALVYSPSAKPKLTNSGRQIGAYNTAGTVDTNACLTSNNIELLAQAVTANWLALHGREGDLAKIVGTDSFNGYLAKYITFAKISRSS